jgi:hypothetical protein
MRTEQVGAVRQIIQVDTSPYTDSERRRLVRGIERLLDEINRGDGVVRPSSGWTRAAVDAALARLDVAQGRLQANVIRRAAAQGGEVSRAEVYEIAGYPPERSLKGFTRPVNRICKELKESAALSSDAEELLAPIYDEDNRSFQRAGGFRVPASVVELLKA